MDPLASKSHQLLGVLLTPVIRWAVKSGVGYGYFKDVAKPLFYRAAAQELMRVNIRSSTAALVLLSGLYKGDVEKFKEGLDLTDKAVPARISLTSQVAARWLIQGLPKVLLLKGEGGFEELVIQSLDGQVKVSPRLVLQDMQRRGLARRNGGSVELLAVDGASGLDAEGGRSHFAHAVHDHMQASLSNLEGEALNGSKFLEQCLTVDCLSIEAVEVLHAMARVWWMDAVRTIGAEAISQADQARASPSSSVSSRLRFGVYFFSEKDNSAT
jgi:hypothetical protein